MYPALTIELVDVDCVRDERQLIAGLTATIRGGELVQLSGVNGAGKTTLVRILVGLRNPDAGSLLYNGQSIRRNYAEFCSNLTYIGHHTGNKAFLTALENLRYFCPHFPEEYLYSALQTIGLYGFEDSPLHALSAGQNQRVALARLILSKNPLWVLDEPFTALDTQAVELVESLMVAHVEQGGIVIFTSHQPMKQQLRTVKMLGLKGSMHG